MANLPENLHGLKAKMTSVKGGITRALKKIETTCVESAKKNGDINSSSHNKQTSTRNPREQGKTGKRA